MTEPSSRNACMLLQLRQFFRGGFVLRIRFCAECRSGQTINTEVPHSVGGTPPVTRPPDPRKPALRPQAASPPALKARGLRVGFVLSKSIALRSVMIAIRDEGIAPSTYRCRCCAGRARG